MGVSAIVVTFNRLQLLKECINNLLQQSYKLDYIFIINNNSNDGTFDYLNNIFNSKIRVKNLQQNLGGAGGFSIGLDFALENSDSEYFWLMDDDTMPTSTSLKSLVVTANELNNDFGFLCSDIKVSGTNIRPNSNIPKVTYDWSAMLDRSLIKVKSATFVSIFIRRINVKKFGLPIQDMFIWGDDTEYTTRISEKRNSYFVPNSIVMHKISLNRPNENIYNSSLSRLLFFKFMYRNLLYITRKYYSRRAFMKLIVNDNLDLMKLPFKSKSHRLRRMIVLIMGIIEGIFFNPKIRFPSKC